MASTGMKSFETSVLGGWTEFDLTWERLQEIAAEHAKGGRPEDAAAHRAKALILARTNFEGKDLRLATSVANHGQGLRQTGDRDSADKLFREALVIWDSAASWIDALKIERRARSSLFHLRMELRHWDQYEATMRKRLHRFADEGREAVLALTKGEQTTLRLHERWIGQKPAQFNDSRKLLGAVFLVAPTTEPIE